MTLTDHDETSLRFAGYNAFLNAAPIWALTVLDWHRPSIVARFDRVYAADVLYQISDHDSLLRCVRSLLSQDGFALIADPGRGVADHELQALVEFENHSLAASGDRADGATEQQGRPGLGDAVGDVRAGEVHAGDFLTREIRAELGDDGLNFGQFRQGESSRTGMRPLSGDADAGLERKTLLKSSGTRLDSLPTPGDYTGCRDAHQRAKDGRGWR